MLLTTVGGVCSDPPVTKWHPLAGVGSVADESGERAVQQVFLSDKLGVVR